MRRLKGQLELGNAPTIVLLVGLTFLVMATIAFIGEKYGEAIPSSKTNTTVNETLTSVDERGEYVATRNACNFEGFAITRCINSTDGVYIAPGNFTTGGNTGKVTAVSTGNIYNGTNWKCTYTNSYAGTACDVNKDLGTEIGNNTSIAGIVLTISLVGIVLAILIGIFLGIRKQRI
jgi:hypothetical protein